MLLFWAFGWLVGSALPAQIRQCSLDRQRGPWNPGQERAEPVTGELYRAGLRRACNSVEPVGRILSQDGAYWLSSDPRGLQFGSIPVSLLSRPEGVKRKGADISCSLITCSLTMTSN